MATAQPETEFARLPQSGQVNGRDRVIGTHAVVVKDRQEPSRRMPRVQRREQILTAAAYLQISALGSDEGLARWAALLAPAVAIEAVIAWLDAGQPDPARLPPGSGKRSWASSAPPSPPPWTAPFPSPEHSPPLTQKDHCHDEHH